jgi:chromatin segregation and condensation protein Rec8/ScpA/Scc1 (kleisin family)
VLFKEKRISFFTRFKDNSVSNAQLITDFLSILVLSTQKKATLKQKRPFEDIIVEGTETLSYPDNIQEIYDWE